MKKFIPIILSFFVCVFSIIPMSSFADEQTDDIQNTVNKATSSSKFPSEGLDNYVRDNVEALFNKYMSFNNKKSSNNIEKVEIDKNSCYVFKVRKLSSTLAQVYFSVDIITTEKDEMVTDKVTIEQLKKNGFAVDLNTTAQVNESINTNPNPNPATENTEVVEDQSNSPESDQNDNTSEETESIEETIEETESIEETVQEESTEETISEETIPEETVVEESNPNNDYIPMTEVDFSLNKGEVDHYYLTANGIIMKSGKVSTNRYNFYLPVELYYTYDNGTPVTSGYRAAGPMNLYSLNETDQTDFEDIIVSPVFAFKEDTKLDEDTTNKMRIKVDKTLGDLYSLRDTSQDFLNYRTFNTYNASYVGIDQFDAYSEPNSLGYNVYVRYTITTSQGFNYTLETYMDVQSSGNSWVIMQIL